MCGVVVDLSEPSVAAANALLFNSPMPAQLVWCYCGVVSFGCANRLPTSARFWENKPTKLQSRERSHICPRNLGLTFTLLKQIVFIEPGNTSMGI